MRSRWRFFYGISDSDRKQIKKHRGVGSASDGVTTAGVLVEVFPPESGENLGRITIELPGRHTESEEMAFAVLEDVEHQLLEKAQSFELKLGLRSCEHLAENSQEKRKLGGRRIYAVQSLEFPEKKDFEAVAEIWATPRHSQMTVMGMIPCARLSDYEVSGCILCGVQSGYVNGREHIIPEALYSNPCTFPKGWVCDKCNSYMADQDRHFAHYKPLAAFAINNRIPGKDKRPRKALGAAVEGGVDFSRGFSSSGISQDESGRLQVSPVEKGNFFTLSKFSRAVHWTCFKVLIDRYGKRTSIDRSLAPLREYVRRAKKGDLWPVYSCADLDREDWTADALFEDQGFAHFCELAVFKVKFLVDLRNSGLIESKAAASSENWRAVTDSGYGFRFGDR